METDPVMVTVRTLFSASGKTLDELGVAMGYDGEIARKSAWQFLNKTADPRFSMLRRFASAMQLPIAELVGMEKSADNTARKLRKALSKHGLHSE